MGRWFMSGIMIQTSAGEDGWHDRGKMLILHPDKRTSAGRAVAGETPAAMRRFDCPRVRPASSAARGIARRGCGIPSRVALLQRLRRLYDKTMHSIDSGWVSSASTRDCPASGWVSSAPPAAGSQPPEELAEELRRTPKNSEELRKCLAVMPVSRRFSRKRIIHQHISSSNVAILTHYLECQEPLCLACAPCVLSQLDLRAPCFNCAALQCKPCVIQL